ncbi:hypothetical protein H5410_050688 [Solanum commersonii]|uniref:Uncharacterized protein n=1 Tax=Solanum commersonii TaxID=4109 RepID=A0A9J5WXS1_SOLCO|nr:hypothetical protein H5410_050688 [Solanum commersonii]
MKQITVKQSTPNVNNNPLPNHNGASVNMIGVYEVPVESIENYILVVVTSLAITISGLKPIEILEAPSQSLVYNTKAVPWNYKQVVIECLGKETATRGFDGATYHAWEIVDVTSVCEESQVKELKMSCAAIMVAQEMLRNRYQHGLGLGKTSNGRGIFLPKPIPTIDQSFSKLVISKTLHMFAKIAYDDIVDGIKSLFLEDEGDHDVAIKDIAETPTVRIVEHESDKNNWSCISAPVHWEFQ